MRNIIWTVIILWLVFRVIELLKNKSKKKIFTNDENQPSSTVSNATTKKDIKSAVQKHMNKEGEYVDFEEIK